MRIIKRIILIPFLALVIMAAPYSAFAQPVDPCTDPADPCPIDSNLIVLVFAAVAIAAKKAYDYKTNTRSI